MDEQRKVSRGQFLGILGGIALTAVAFKFSAFKHVLAAEKKQGETSASANSYGNHTYGGKSA